MEGHLQTRVGGGGCGKGDREIDIFRSCGRILRYNHNG